jgi:hypothetical protein
MGCLVGFRVGRRIGDGTIGFGRTMCWRTDWWTCDWCNGPGQEYWTTRVSLTSILSTFWNTPPLPSMTSSKNALPYVSLHYSHPTAKKSTICNEGDTRRPSFLAPYPIAVSSCPSTGRDWLDSIERMVQKHFPSILISIMPLAVDPESYHHVRDIIKIICQGIEIVSPLPNSILPCAFTTVSC